jgi:hypothetical protein
MLHFKFSQRWLRDITPCSLLKVNRHFGGTYRLHLQDQQSLPPAFMLASCSAYSSTLKMEAIYSSETSVDFQRIIRRYIPEDGTLHSLEQFQCNFSRNFLAAR